MDGRIALLGRPGSNAGAVRCRWPAASPGDCSPDKVQASDPPDSYARLVAVKDRYDPTNLFRSTRTSAPRADADRRQSSR